MNNPFDPKHRTIRFMVNKIRENKQHEIRTIWDQMIKEETMKIVVNA